MKSLVSDYTSVDRELRAFELLTTTASTAGDSPGKKHVRHALDQFKIDHAGRTYHFLVHEPLGVHFSQLQELYDYILPFGKSQVSILQMLLAIEYLHNKARLIHAGKFRIKIR